MSNDEYDTISQQQQSSVPSRTPESIKQFLYDESGKLRADIVSIIGDDKNYLLLEKRGTRQKKVAAVMDYIAPRSDANKKWNEGEEPRSNTTSDDATNLCIFLGSISNWNINRAAAAINRLLVNKQCKLIKDHITNQTKKFSDETVGNVFAHILWNASSNRPEV